MRMEYLQEWGWLRGSAARSTSACRWWLPSIEGSVWYSPSYPLPIHHCKIEEKIKKRKKNWTDGNPSQTWWRCTGPGGSVSSANSNYRRWRRCAEAARQSSSRGTIWSDPLCKSEGSGRDWRPPGSIPCTSAKDKEKNIFKRFFFFLRNEYLVLRRWCFHCSEWGGCGGFRLRGDRPRKSYPGRHGSKSDASLWFVSLESAIVPIGHGLDWEFIIFWTKVFFLFCFYLSVVVCDLDAFAFGRKDPGSYGYVEFAFCARLDPHVIALRLKKKEKSNFGKWWKKGR